ncbi:MAG: tetratricopeptide (TPR) repeat protein [Marivirga sp.]|jgi:tetratricopeptide (TPR) repeat protein
MKKVVVTLAFLITGHLAFSQSVLEMANEANCNTQDNLIKTAEKSSLHSRRSLKASTWVRLSNAYATHTTACGRDSTSSIKAYEALNKARELDTDGNAAASIEEVSNGTALSPLYSAVINQGVAHYNNNNLEMAAELFLLGMKVAPKDTLSTFYAGIVSNTLENYDDAERAFTQFIEVAGGVDAVAYYQLAAYAKNKDAIEDAIEWLKKGIAVTGDKDLQGELINIYITNDMLGKAVVDLKTLVDADTTNTNNMLNLAILYDNQGNKEMALATYVKVLEIDPLNYDCNFNMAVFHFNEAVKIKQQVDAMTMAEYREGGKEIEVKVCERFNESKPFFDACMKVKPEDPSLKESVTNLTNVLAQCND